MAFPALLFAIALASTAGTQLNGITFGGLVGEGVVTLVLVFTVFGWFYPAGSSGEGALAPREGVHRGGADDRCERHADHPLAPPAAPRGADHRLLDADRRRLRPEARRLSFLGVGIQPPTASWGNLLWTRRSSTPRSAADALAGHLAVLTTLAFNLLGDGLRDAFDPRSRL